MKKYLKRIFRTLWKRSLLRFYENDPNNFYVALRLAKRMRKIKGGDPRIIKRLKECKNGHIYG